MTNYRIVTSEDATEVTHELKADTVGLAVTEACWIWGKVPAKVRAYALLKHKGKDQWIECYVAPDFLRVLGSVYG